MEPWQTLVLVGAAIAGYGWLLPQTKKGEITDTNTLQSDEAYDRLLEDLEAENRELVDAVASFKKEQDETVNRLSSRIRELEAQMGELRASAGAIAARRTDASAASAEARRDERPDAEADAVRAEADAVRAEAGGYAAAAAPAAYAAPPSEPEPDAMPDRSAEPADPIPEPQSIRVRYGELLELYGRGRSVEQIAKALGMNKGEVQLILQLAKREEEQHA